MEIMLKKMGNSTALILPPPVLRDLGMKAGQPLRLSTTSDGKVVLEHKRKHQLADLIAQCNPKAELPADMALWDQSKPAGHEVW
ncbi:MAG: ChpB-ChpS toxin-antitoxin system antitoxin [Betaproteobacteria bacterium]|jgi:antitoxin ChpS|nr:ChpB-ChpS toxin-antitoxin system antitoxin [Betaproteobacteria bacterium]